MDGPEGDPHLLTRRRALALLGAGGVGIVGAAAVASACGSNPPDADSRPNIILVIVDDMRYDQLPFMPNVKRLITDQGRAFTQARCNVPLCQPSRVALHTGQMSKHNNELGIGFYGTRLRDHDNALGKWLHDAGYRCGLFGKYINHVDGTGGIDAPAGYSTWREITRFEQGYEFGVHGNTGTATVSGTYSTDYLAAETRRFVKGSQPFFCMVTPTEAHAPFTPRKDLAEKWLDHKFPIVDEVDVSDKPAWIRGLRALTDDDKATIEEQAIGSLQELSAVDDMVDKIFAGLPPAILANTVVILVSDNGVHRGEHRRLGAGTKSGPYEVGLRVPLVARGPGFSPGPDVTAPVMAFQDLAATLLDLGEAQPRLPHQSGVSLVDVCPRPRAHRDRILLHEVGEGFERQTGDGITTGPGSSRGFRKLYRYPSVRKSPEGPFVYEAYDLDTDPDELSNWADDPDRRAEHDALEAELVSLREA